jgi:very-short-patch-repair endonuclease
MKDANAENHKRAKQHRRELTAAEDVLWQELRRKQLGGFHFRRQVPIGPYFADFACVKLTALAMQSLMKLRGTKNVQPI